MSKTVCCQFEDKLMDMWSGLFVKLSSWQAELDFEPRPALSEIFCHFLSDNIKKMADALLEPWLMWVFSFFQSEGGRHRPR